MVISRRITPVLCGASLRDKGIQPLLDAVVDYLPSPKDSQQIKGLQPETKKEIARQISREEPFSAMAFKSVFDDQGILTFIRIYSGSISKGTTILNANKGQKERVGRLYQIHAAKLQEISEASTGAICAIRGAKTLITGDTICDPNHPITYSSMNFAKPVVSIAVSPKSHEDRDRMAIALSKMAIQDPTLIRKTDPETEETILSGMGELHLEVTLDRLKTEHKVEVLASQPQVAYKQTISGSCDIEGRHIKQSGGHGQFGIVNIKFEYDPNADPYIFVDAVVGGSVPREYIPSVEKGLKKAFEEGGILGVPFVNIRATLHFGEDHDVDSSDLAFQLAAVDAFRECLKSCRVVLLEPRMKFEVQCPEEFTGSVIGHLTSKRANIESMNQNGLIKSIRGIVPISEMFAYITSLRSMTSGRGSFVMEPFDYAVVPQAIAEKVFSQAQKLRQERNK